MLIGLAKILLVWWIVTIMVGWYRRNISRPKQNDRSDREGGPVSMPDRRGDIVDAEFEDIDDAKR
jgi:hypothetical protein